MKKPVAVVSGGAGFIGSHMVDLLVENGFSVRVIDSLVGGRNENMAHHRHGQDVILEEKDIRSYHPENSFFKSASLVSSVRTS
jgi:UDP-glucose 4-epimerase